MAYTTEDLEQLEAALATGAKEVEYNDRKTTFRSIKELKEAIQVVKRSLGLVNSGGRLLCQSSKGTV